MSDLSGHADDLFTCSGGTWTVQTCANGCTVSSSGPDSCSAPTCPCYAGNGAYCGSEVQTYANQNGCTVADLAANTGNLLACSNGNWSVQQTCTAGCSYNPNGPDSCSTPTTATNRLWIAWDANVATCASHVTQFYDCVLGTTNFNAMALAYAQGESVSLAGTVTLGSACGTTDFQCIEDQAGWDLKPYDIVLHYYGTSWQGGTNGARTLNVNGQSVPVNVAWVEAGTNCDGQTCTGAHEVYEAATDGVSADCCNGQVASTSCPNCDASCGRYNGNQGNPPWGCYSLTCGGATYSMELLSVAGNQYDASGCTQVH